MEWLYISGKILLLTPSVCMRMQVVLGTLLAALVPVVGFNAVLTSEHFASFLVSFFFISLLCIPLNLVLSLLILILSVKFTID